MKTTNQFLTRFSVSMLMMLFSITFVTAQSEEANYRSYKGVVVDQISSAPIPFTTVQLKGSSTGTVCNSNGEFSLKVEKNSPVQSIVFSIIGYQTKEVALSSLTEDVNKIKLDILAIKLSEVKVFPTDPKMLIRAVMDRRDENYSTEPMLMTEFYRETIKKGKSYVSLSEAVLQVYKQSYMSGRSDQIKISKGRKSVDYDKLDTLTFKLQGGPYTALMLDLMKNPYAILDNEMVDSYDFTISNITKINDKTVYVVDFKQKQSVTDVLFYGKLYIESESLAITSASYKMNLEDKEAAANLLIRKKPFGADVYPTETNYLVNYVEKDGKWYYSYSRGEITFKIDWKKKLFNTIYYTTIEAAATDWSKDIPATFTASDKLKMNAIMEESVSGFSDEAFWGEYNTIEPEQPIENAIKKISKNLDKIK